MEFRLYYNTDGTVKTYSMEDLEGDYITISALEFAECRYDIRVIDRRIVRNLDLNYLIYRPVDKKTDRSVHRDNYSIVVDDDHEYCQYLELRLPEEYYQYR